MTVTFRILHHGRCVRRSNIIECLVATLQRLLARDGTLQGVSVAWAGDRCSGSAFLAWAESVLREHRAPPLPTDSLE